MNIEELKKEKEEVDYRIGMLKAKIDRAKRDAAKSGKFMSPSEMQSKETKLAGLKRRSQEIQRLLGSNREQAGLPVYFMNIAEETLPPQEFNRLLEMALTRQRSGAK